LTPAAPPPRLFDPDVVRPDPSSALGRVAIALEEDPARALELARASLGEATGEERARIAWLGARAAERARLSDHAIELFGTIAESDHPLAPWAGLARARLRLETDPALAASEAAALGEALWAGQREARELHATALLRAARPEQGAPSGPRRPRRSCARCSTRRRAMPRRRAWRCRWPSCTPRAASRWRRCGSGVGSPSVARSRVPVATPPAARERGSRRSRPRSAPS